MKTTKNFLAFFTFFATCPKNLEGLLEEELIALGARQTKQTVAGVNFSGDLALAYRACLWSRLANHILLPLKTINAENAEALYEGISAINWLDHLRPTNSLMIDFSGTSFTIKNSHFGALKVKDAIVDQIRKKTGVRPSIDKDKPDIRINVYLDNITAIVSIDLSGESLHRRGYRSAPGAAPLKENLAAAILYRSKWLNFAKEGKPLFDPMCGSGTILIEGALMAQDIAPGLLRETFGFSRWLNHEPHIWQDLITEANERREIGKRNLASKICGCDVDPKVIAMTKSCIRKANLENIIKISVSPIKGIIPAQYKLDNPGIIVTNPPYGKRLDEVENLAGLYRDFGEVLRCDFVAWEVAMITGNPDLGKNMGIRSYKQYNFFNGSIPCKLLLFRISPEMFWREYKGDKSIS